MGPSITRPAATGFASLLLIVLFGGCSRTVLLPGSPGSTADPDEGVRVVPDPDLGPRDRGVEQRPDLGVALDQGPPDVGPPDEGMGDSGPPPIAFRRCDAPTVPTADDCGPTCGDGMRDPVSSGSALCLDDEGLEACDGLALDGQSCQTLGFEAGTISCAPWCSFETAGCDSCVRGESTRDCATLGGIGWDPTALDIAVNGGFAYVAWIEGRAARLARVSLEDLSDQEILGCLSDDAVDVSVARFVDGVAVAVTTTLGLVELSRIDGLGRNRGLLLAGVQGTEGRVTARGEFILLLRNDGTAPVALEFGPNGVVQWNRRILVDDGFSRAFAVSVGDAYLVAMETDDDLWLRRVDGEGFLGPLLRKANVPGLEGFVGRDGGADLLFFDGVLLLFDELDRNGRRVGRPWIVDSFNGGRPDPPGRLATSGEQVAFMTPSAIRLAGRDGPLQDAIRFARDPRDNLLRVPPQPLRTLELDDGSLLVAALRPSGRDGGRRRLGLGVRGAITLTRVQP